MSNLTRAVAVAFLAGLTVSACSGSSATKSTSAAKAMYLQQANGVCDNANSQEASLATPPDPSHDPSKLPAWSEYLQQIVDQNGATIAGLKALKPPTGDKGKVDAFLAAADAHQQKLVAAQQAAASNDVSKLAAALEKLTTETAVYHDARAYGLTSCAS